MRRVVLVVLAVAIAAAALAALLLAPVVPRVQPFDLSGALPTGTSYFNGQERCGPNVTISNPFPSDGAVSYNYAQNETGADVNIWILTAGTSVFTSSGSGSGHGELTTGFGSNSITFKGCGPGASVDIAFWGSTHYSGPVL